MKSEIHFTFEIPKIIFPADIISKTLLDIIIGLKSEEINDELITKQLHKKLGNIFPKIKEYVFELIKYSSDYLELLCNVYLFSVCVKKK